MDRLSLSMLRIGALLLMSGMATALVSALLLGCKLAPLAVTIMGTGLGIFVLGVLVEVFRPRR